jgi:hypothetical protein
MSAIYHDAQRTVPDWKRSDWVCDVLPESDPAREPAATVEF